MLPSGYRAQCRLEIHWSQAQVLPWPPARLVPSNMPWGWTLSLLLNIPCPKSELCGLYNLLWSSVYFLVGHSSCLLTFSVPLPSSTWHDSSVKAGYLNLHVFSSFTWGTSTADMVYTWRQKILEPVNPTTKPLWKKKDNMEEWWILLNLLLNCIDHNHCNVEDNKSLKQHRKQTWSFCWWTGKLLALIFNIPPPEKHNMSCKKIVSGFFKKYQNCLSL